MANDTQNVGAKAPKCSDIPSLPEASTPRRPQPLSPNIQIYRPQLTSVLSIVNRITGVIASLAGVALVAWLLAATSGPQAYAAMQSAIRSWLGQVVLVCFTFAFFLHFCGGIRHLVWDAGYGFELRSIYAGGWAVVIASMVLTAAVWVASSFLAG
jgi:succinate dehydrogenase / fumarate reductase cytochrome b subunit